MVNESRLRNFIREYASKTAAEFSGELMKELEEFKGENSFNDGITMVVLNVV